MLLHQVEILCPRIAGEAPTHSSPQPVKMAMGANYSDDYLVQDVAYRVHSVRVWGEDRVECIQFVYKHSSTGDLREGCQEGIPQNTQRAVEFALYAHEFITGASLFNRNFLRRAHLDEFELMTVCKRVFHFPAVGTPWSVGLQQKEVRAVRLSIENSTIVGFQPVEMEAPFRLSLEAQESLYQPLIRSPAFRVCEVKVWQNSNSPNEFVGLQCNYRRKGPPFEWIEGFKCGKLCFQMETKVHHLSESEFISSAMCCVGDNGEIEQLRLHLNNGSSITGGSSNSSNYKLACRHTGTDSEIHGLRRLETDETGRVVKLGMQENQRTESYDTAEFDSTFSSILEHIADPENATKLGDTLLQGDSDDVQGPCELSSVTLEEYENGILR